LTTISTNFPHRKELIEFFFEFSGTLLLRRNYPDKIVNRRRPIYDVSGINKLDEKKLDEEAEGDPGDSEHEHGVLYPC
jgi:hypothetical protein